MDKLFGMCVTQKPQSEKDTFAICKEIAESELFLDLFHKSYRICHLNKAYAQHINDTGCFMIMLESKEKNGPNGIFCLSKSDVTTKGSVFCLCSSPGAKGEMLRVEWEPYEYPCVILKHNFKRGDLELKNNRVSLHYKGRIFST